MFGVLKHLIKVLLYCNSSGHQVKFNSTNTMEKYSIFSEMIEHKLHTYIAIYIEQRARHPVKTL